MERARADVLVDADVVDGCEGVAACKGITGAEGEPLEVRRHLAAPAPLRLPDVAADVQGKDGGAVTAATLRALLRQQLAAGHSPARGSPRLADRVRSTGVNAGKSPQERRLPVRAVASMLLRLSPGYVLAVGLFVALLVLGLATVEQGRDLTARVGASSRRQANARMLLLAALESCSGQDQVRGVESVRASGTK